MDLFKEKNGNLGGEARASYYISKYENIQTFIDKGEGYMRTYCQNIVIDSSLESFSFNYFKNRVNAELEELKRIIHKDIRNGRDLMISLLLGLYDNLILSDKEDEIFEKDDFTQIFIINKGNTDCITIFLYINKGFKGSIYPKDEVSIATSGYGLNKPIMKETAINQKCKKIDYRTLKDTKKENHEKRKINENLSKQ